MCGQVLVCRSMVSKVSLKVLLWLSISALFGIVLAMGLHYYGLRATTPAYSVNFLNLIPVVTFIGADIGGLLGGAIITESVFNIPGLGRAVFDAISRQEGAVVVGIVTLLVFFFIFFNLVVDVLYAVLDPRIRYE